MTAHDLDVDALASMYGCDLKSDYRTQFEHRVKIVKGWDIRPGSRVLEIGPGQGDCTIVLAAAVGEQGHVDAVDPAPLDYGSPTTLGESQAHLSASPLGPRITWIHASPSTYLSNLPSSSPLSTQASKTPTTKYTHIVLFHSLWYFATPSTLPTILHALHPHITPSATLCVAEYALRASTLAAVPHVLAALAQTTLEAAGVEESARNVRTVVGPEWIRAVAREEGWMVGDERVVVPPKGMADGRWEVEAAVGEEFQKGVEAVAGRNAAVGGALRGMREAVMGAVVGIGGSVRGVQTMDVWAARLVREIGGE